MQARKSGAMARLGWKQVFTIAALSAAFSILIYAGKTLGKDNEFSVSIIVAAIIILVIYIVSLIERRYFSP